jgi:epoxyqueuosine reductase QueG
VLDAKYIKNIAFQNGADLCGIATIERFHEAPVGFRPEDMYADAKSVVVVARKFPEGPFLSKSPIPYTSTSDTLLHEVIMLTCQLCCLLEQAEEVIAVPVPSEPYECWDAENREGRGLLSLRHAGYLAGLGTMGKNTLLANEQYGNRIVLGAVLLNIEVESDQVADYDFCHESCSLCIESCSSGALDGKRVSQKLCRTHSEGLTKKGYSIYTCNTCRKICPGGKGIRSRP